MARCISCCVGVWDGKVLDVDDLENDYPEWKNDGTRHMAVD